MIIVVYSQHQLTCAKLPFVHPEYFLTVCCAGSVSGLVLCSGVIHRMSPLQPIESISCEPAQLLPSRTDSGIARNHKDSNNNYCDIQLTSSGMYIVF